MVKKERRSSRDTKYARVHIKNHLFDGNKFNKSFDFLTRFVNKVDISNMTEALAFIALPTFLADPADA